MLNEALETITGEIRQHLGSQASVETHPGRFSESELGKIVQPCARNVRVSFENIPAMDVLGNGERRVTPLMVAMIITKDDQDASRHVHTIDLVEALTLFLPYQRWGNDAMFSAIQPKDIQSDNLYSGSLEGRGIALWGIGWTQTIRKGKEQ